MSLYSETQCLHPVLPIQSCKWLRYDFETLRLFSFLTLYFKLIMDETTIDILSLFCFLFLSRFSIKCKLSYTILLQDFSPTMTLPASWFLIQILHLYKGFSFSSLFSNNNVSKDSCFSIRCNWICWKGKELNSGNQSMIQLCLSHQN